MTTDDNDRTRVPRPQSPSESEGEPELELEREHDTEAGHEPERFQCPNCHFELTPDDVGVIIFEEATVYHCPICKKTMALMPRFPKRAPPGSDQSE